MSTQHKSFFRLECDGEDCEAIASADWMDEDSTYSDAEQQGWQVREGDDLCPACRAKRDEQYERNERERREAMAEVEGK